MRPTNTRPQLLLPDKAPVRCMFACQADAPIFWEECETDATELISDAKSEAIYGWLKNHPKAIVTVMRSTGPLYLCDAHIGVFADVIEYAS